MFETFIKLFRKDKNETKEYLSCRHLQGGITFMHDSIRTCCSIKQGIVFFKNYKGEKINWNKIYKERKKVINKQEQQLETNIQPKEEYKIIEKEEIVEEDILKKYLEENE